MSDNDDIPVLAVLRDQLTAAIARRTTTKRRPLALGAGLVLVIALVVAAGLATRPSGHDRTVALRGRAAGHPQASDIAPATTTATTGTTIVGAAGSTPSVTAASPIINAPSPPTTHRTGTATTTPAGTAPPAPPITITLRVADSNRTVSVTTGTTLEVQLDGDATAIWPVEPTSANQRVVRRVSGSSSPTSSRAAFVAVGPGTVELTATGGPPCSQQPPPTGPPQACPQYAALWTATISVASP